MKEALPTSQPYERKYVSTVGDIDNWIDPSSGIVGSTARAGFYLEALRACKTGAEKAVATSMSEGVDPSKAKKFLDMTYVVIGRLANTSERRLRQQAEANGGNMPSSGIPGVDAPRTVSMLDIETVKEKFAPNDPRTENYIDLAAINEVIAKVDEVALAMERDPR